MQALRPEQVRVLLARKSAAGLSPRSVQIVHGTLRAMLAEAVREELITRNPAAIVRPPSLVHEEVKPWSPEEASQFLRATASHRLYALFAVGVAVGLRKGELLALQWSEVDLDQGLVHVRQNVQRLPELGLVYGRPKTARSRRTIPLPARSVKVLRAHRARQAAEVLALGPAWNESGPVLTSSVGTLIEPPNLSRLFDQLIAAAGVRRTVPRPAADLRFAVVGSGHAAASGDGRARALTDRDHDGPVFTRHADSLAGSSRRDRSGAGSRRMKSDRSGLDQI